MTMKKTLAAFLAPLALSLASLSSAAQAQSPAPGQVYIRSIQYNGSGCPVGSVAGNVSPDKKAFTLTFAEYIADVGPQRRIDRKFCQLIVNLQIPQGYQFSIGTFDYRGFIALDPGTQAMHQTSYYFQGQGQTGRFNKRIFGPNFDDFFFREQVGLESLVWSPCGAQRALNIKTSLMARSDGRGYGLIGNDSVDGEIRQIYGLRWRRCR